MDGEWGFCQYCAFLIPVEDGRLFVHERRDGGWSTTRCYGSNMEPTEQPAPEAHPKSYMDVIAEALSGEDDDNE